MKNHKAILFLVVCSFLMIGSCAILRKNRQLRIAKKEYSTLIDNQKMIEDSINQQLFIMDSLETELYNIALMTNYRIDSLNKENDSLEVIMQRFLNQIDSLNTINDTLMKNHNNR